MSHFAEGLTSLMYHAVISGLGRVLIALLLLGIFALAILNAIVYWKHITQQIAEHRTGGSSVVARPVILSGITLALVLIAASLI